MQNDQAFFIIRAKDTSGIGECDFFIPRTEVDHWCKYNINRAYDYQSLIEMMPNPLAIFRNLKRNGHKHGVCYSGRPKEYQQQSESPARPRWVFVAYANKDRIIIDFGWELEDEKNTGMPEASTTRFGEVLWKH